jgi:hypothetical protein
MSEASLWNYVREGLLPVGIHATRLEPSDEGVGAGFPDVHYSILRGNGTRSSGTIELKFLRKKNPPFGDEGLRLSQRIWIRDELEAGGLVWILADIGRTIHLIRGIHYKTFNEWDLTDFKTQSLIIFPKNNRKLLRERKAELAIFL